MLAVKDLRINEQIRVREVRLIDDAGEQKGIISTKDALAMAKELEVDLVEVAPQSKPPV
jgi:translation initiation factor IF-3